MDQWIDERLASLEPATNWEPNADRALEQLRARKSSANPRWMRIGMTATIFATTGAVLLMLPWQGFWKPKEVVAPKPVTKIAQQQQQRAEPAKPEEKPAAESPKAPSATPQLQSSNDLADLTEEELRQYLQKIAALRSAVAQVGGETEPKLIKNAYPKYTDEASKAKITGNVEVEFTIRTDGTVRFERFISTLGYGLDESAREAAEQMVFEPARKDGVAVEKISRVKFGFSLR
jgi:TonB family protein